MTDKDKFMHLIAGGIVSNGKLKLKLNGDGELQLLGKYTETSVIRWLDNWEIYHEPKWEDNIPKEGRFCRVWDHDGDDYMFVTVGEYSEYEKYPYRYLYNDGTVLGFLNAEPLTDDEIAAYNFLYKKG